ncbi:hypothetical protein GCM10017655_10980 [Pseudomonas turukhanskensis]|uniref:Uncharacterized protein n=1 Tax=Pseudomonas turukhanskensis TaxID=1806536 RepID=A0A9W6K212_9PSED|nr:hypothetical protein GCM10017655_10980 [Pseudomonas turukhanskensis]
MVCQWLINTATAIACSPAATLTANACRDQARLGQCKRGIGWAAGINAALIAAPR